MAKRSPTPAEAAPRRGTVGRPRRTPTQTDRAPEEEILFQSGRLFVKKGFNATSTREIASASGLQQGSIFYYFSSKEEILVALSDRAMQHPLESMARALASPARPSARFYRVIWDLAAFKYGEPYDITPVLMHAQVERGRFTKFITDVETYLQGAHHLVAQGVVAGEFVPVHEGLAVTALLGIVNWPSIWARREGSVTPKLAASELARLAVRSLLVDQSSFDSIVAEAHAIEPPLRSAAPAP